MASVMQTLGFPAGCCLVKVIRKMLCAVTVSDYIAVKRIVLMIMAFEGTEIDSPKNSPAKNGA